ncbi:helix-turn-helix domain-containing protein [Pseudonocardia hispaniensis]|uniref:Helix-turn-helix domain-containing protein n=1 Tax=Pseudonocardia hispaniensis TaxID=904933 RepID=A0ABW1J223_9PSEU
MQRVLPDGCMDLMWIDSTLMVAGPDTTAHLARLAPGSTITGLRLRPGIAACLLATSAEELRNQRVPLGWSVRSLHRRCLAAFGYGPAVLRRILHFRAALRLADAGVPAAEVAARCGYADQPHLSREVRALAGVPLGQLLAGRGANRSTPLPSGSCTTA